MKQESAKTIPMSEEEFCDSLGIARVTAWRARKEGKLPYCRIGRSVKYLPRHREEYLNACERNGSKDAE